MQIQYKYNTNTIQIQYKYNTNTIQTHNQTIKQSADLQSGVLEHVGGETSGRFTSPYPSAVGGRHRAGPNLSGGCVKRKNTLGGSR